MFRDKFLCILHGLRFSQSSVISSSRLHSKRNYFDRDSPSLNRKFSNSVLYWRRSVSRLPLSSRVDLLSFIKVYILYTVPVSSSVSLYKLTHVVCV